MNLRELTIERKRSGTKPTFSIGPKGNLHINKPAVNLMACKYWERVGLFNDTESPNNWYISVSNNGAKVCYWKNDTLRGGGATEFYKRLSQQFGISGVVRFSIHPQPSEINGNKYYRLIIQK